MERLLSCNFRKFVVVKSITVRTITKYLFFFLLLLLFNFFICLLICDTFGKDKKLVIFFKLANIIMVAFDF